MFKKIILSLLLGSVIAQPIMATPIDTVQASSVVTSSVATCTNKCINSCKEANSNLIIKTAEFVSEHPVGCIGGALALSAFAFYVLIWPDVSIKFQIAYTKNSRAELQAARR